VAEEAPSSAAAPAAVQPAAVQPTPPEPAPAPLPEESPAPFAERSRLGFLPAYGATWREVAARPEEFFSRLRGDRAASAVLYGLLSGTVGLFVSRFYSILNERHWYDASRDVVETLPPDTAQVVERYLPYLATRFSLWEALTSPLKIMVGILVGAVVMHLFLLLFRARPRGFRTTLTTVGYGFGISILLAVPVCGFPVTAAWLAVVLVVGLAAAHRCSRGKAAAAVLLPGVLVILFGFGTWLRGMFALVDTVRGAGGP
jgi:hypothetical protein